MQTSLKKIYIIRNKFIIKENPKILNKLFKKLENNKYIFVTHFSK